MRCTFLGRLMDGDGRSLIYSAGGGRARDVGNGGGRGIDGDFDKVAIK